MLRRAMVGLVVPLMLVAAFGCGESGKAEAPKVQNPTVKVKPSGDGKSPTGGAKFKSED